MSTELKLISVNIEQSKHLDLVSAFLRVQRPDVVCIQELFERDTGHIAQATGAVAQVFAPMTRHVAEVPPAIMGVGIFSRLPFVSTQADYYRGTREHVPDFEWSDLNTFNMKCHPLLQCQVKKGEDIFRVATTHFMWTPDGQPDAFQRQDIRNLIVLLERSGEFVLAGDFNAPRGGEIFGVLAEKYKDNVPPRYMTSLDASLHRVGKERPHELADKMVDGLFSTAAYTVSHVELVSGVSDHCAIVATVSTSQN